MTGYGSKFTGNKEKALAALIRQPTMAAAAKEAGISTKTCSDGGGCRNSRSTADQWPDQSWGYRRCR